MYLIPGFWIGLGIAPSVLSLYQESSPEQKGIIVPQSTRLFIQPRQPETCAGLQVLLETHEGIISMHEKNSHLMGIVASAISQEIIQKEV